VINISCMTSFGGEVKSVVPCRNILQHVNNPCSMKEKLVRKIHGHFWLSSSWFAIMCLYWLLPESSGSKSGMIRTQVERHNSSVMAAVYGKPRKQEQ